MKQHTQKVGWVDSFASEEATDGRQVHQPAEECECLVNFPDFLQVLGLLA